VAGIYVFYDVSERPIYVGHADIKTRIRTHREKFWFRSPIAQTGDVKIDEKGLREKAETLLIRFLNSSLRGSWPYGRPA